MAPTKSLLLVNGSDAIGGVEDGSSLTYHPRLRAHLMYAENHGLVIGYDATASANPTSAVRVLFNASIPPGEAAHSETKHVKHMVSRVVEGHSTL